MKKHSLHIHGTTSLYHLMIVKLHAPRLYLDKKYSHRNYSIILKNTYFQKPLVGCFRSVLNFVRTSSHLLNTQSNGTGCFYIFNSLVDVFEKNVFCVCVKRETHSTLNCLCSYSSCCPSSRFSASRIRDFGIVNRYSWF